MIDFKINTNNMEYFNSIQDKLYFCEYDHINLIDSCSNCLNNKNRKIKCPYKKPYNENYDYMI